MSGQAVLEPLGPPMGDAPHVALHLKPLKEAPDRYPSCGFEGQLGKATAIGELRRALCQKLRISQDALVLMNEGKDLADEHDLAANDVSLPGPARRRAGEKVQILFDLLWDHSSLISEEDAEKARAEKERQERLRLTAEEREREQKEQEEAIRAVEQATRLEEDIGRKLGWREEQLPAQIASDPEFVVPKHRLEPVSEDIHKAVLALFAATSGVSQHNFVRVMRVVNPTLAHRYELARQNLVRAVNDGRLKIKQHVVHTYTTMKSDRKLYGCLGEYEACVNELPLWHGTPTAESANGICENGFDIAHVRHTSAYSPGFYFAENAKTSLGYTNVWSLNGQHPGMRVMLLCRNLCGIIYHTGHVTTDAEKERLTSECLGPGGTFGPGSKIHSILGDRWAHVCMHRDQVLPEYMILFDSGGRR